MEPYRGMNHLEYKEAHYECKFQLKFEGSETYEIESGTERAIAYAEAGAVLMARFRNRLEYEEKLAGRPLAHKFKLHVDGNKVTSESEIYT